MPLLDPSDGHPDDQPDLVDLPDNEDGDYDDRPIYDWCRAQGWEDCRDCPDCDGSGMEDFLPCDTCDGEGIIDL